MSILRTRQGLALSALAALFVPTASAQVSHGGVPAGLQAPFDEPAPVVVVDPPDVRAYLAEDIARQHRPMRYGALLDLDLTIEDGEWTDLEDGSRAWRVRIVSNGAKSLAVEFDQFLLPEGARMFVYNEEVEGFLGSYTRDNEHLEGGFVFEPFRGSDMVIEIDVPAGAADPIIDTATLIYDYRDVFGLMDGTVSLHELDETEALGGCLIDVNCPQGDGWDTQIRATMRTVSGGALCSGALINNTAQDGTRYVLTADHCGQGSNTVFMFGYERSGCGTGAAPQTMTVSGATVLATTGTYDCRLLRINPSIPDSYMPYYAGWTRSNSNTSFAVALGHPSGGPKKISIDSTGAVRESQLWRVTWHEGTLEGGSSGGPLFDQNGRINGPACCVNVFNCNQTAWFGRFDRFWSTQSLAQWLDPLGTGQTTLDGFEPLCPAPTPTCGTSPNSVGSGAVMGWFGSNSYSDNNFTMTVSSCPPNTSGLFFYGPNQSFTPLGNGFRCVGDPLVRLFPTPTDFLGIAVNPFDLTQTTIVPGETIYFQYWYRDPAGGGSFFNLSNALCVPFCAN